MRQECCHIYSHDSREPVGLTGPVGVTGSTGDTGAMEIKKLKFKYLRKSIQGDNKMAPMP